MVQYHEELNAYYDYFNESYAELSDDVRNNITLPEHIQVMMENNDPNTLPVMPRNPRREEMRRNAELSIAQRTRERIAAIRARAARQEQ